MNYKNIMLCVLSVICISLTCNAKPSQNNNNLKVTILSLFSGSTKLTYERLIVQKQSLEITGGIIGAGMDILNHNGAKGALCRLAYKFIFKEEQQSPLDGFYVKPEFAFSSYSYKYEEERLSVNRLAVMGCTGYQIVKNWFVFDIFAGMGFGVGDANKSNYHHGYIGFNSSSPFAFTAGFKLGVVF